MADWQAITSILQIGGLSGLTAAGAKWAIDAFWVERRKNQNDAQYAAIRSVVILERYVLQAEAHLSDREVEFDVHGLNDAGKLPTLDPFPPDINWRAFDPDLAFDILGFPGRVELAQGNCNRAGWESSEYFHSQQEAMRLGIVAWQIAEAVRTRYSLGTNEKVAKLLPLLKDRRMEQARRQGEFLAKRSDEKQAAALAGIDQITGKAPDVP